VARLIGRRGAPTRIRSDNGSESICAALTNMLSGIGAQPIPVAAGTFTPFDVIFPLTGGRNATIRAYGAGNEYIELPINVDSPAARYNDPYTRPRGLLINPYGPPP